jgi:hypothetical protein
MARRAPLRRHERAATISDSKLGEHGENSRADLLRIGFARMESHGRLHLLLGEYVGQVVMQVPASDLMMLGRFPGGRVRPRRLAAQEIQLGIGSAEALVRQPRRWPVDAADTRVATADTRWPGSIGSWS